MKKNTHSRDMALLLIASFFFMACPMLVTPLITGFSETLGAAGAVMGIIGGLMNLCSMVCRPVAGNMADRWSKYTLALIGTVLMALSCAGYAVAQSNSILVAARLLHGVGFSCCSVCLATWLSGLLPREKVGSGMGLYGTMNALAMALAPSIGIRVSNWLGYRAVFALAAAFAVLAGVAIQFVSDKGAPKAAAEVSRRGLRIIDRKVIPVALVTLLFTIPYCATQSFLVSYVKARQIGVSASLFFPLYAAALLALRLSCKSYFDKVKYRTFMTISAASALGAMLCLTFMQGSLLMVCAAVLMAGGYGIMCSVSQSNAILLADRGREGLANSTYYLGLDMGMALGPIIGGVLYGGVDIALFYPALMLTVPLCFLIPQSRALKVPADSGEGK